MVSLVLSGLTAGTFLATQLGQVRVQNTLNARDFTLVKHAFEFAVGDVMPPLVILTVLMQITLLMLLLPDVRSLRFALVAVSVLAWIAAVVVTLVFCAPVNALAATWDAAAPPANWAQLRDQWHTGQTLRTLLTVPAFALLATAFITGHHHTPRP